MAELNKASGKFQLTYWLVIIAAINLIGFFISFQYGWIICTAAGILSQPITNAMQKRKYASLIKKKEQQK